jgi:hypothetical protein
MHIFESVNSQIIYRSNSVWGPVWDDSLNKKVGYNSRSIVPFLTIYPCFDKNKKYIRAYVCQSCSHFRQTYKIKKVYLHTIQQYFSDLYTYLGICMNQLIEFYIVNVQKLYIYLANIWEIHKKHIKTTHIQVLHDNLQDIIERGEWI